ncbi:MAG TPA: hypothetical protein VGN01_00950 [Acidobacteriaceae bacterium]|jgi:hypothetical protein
MRLRPASAFYVLQLMALRCVSLLVPGGRRREWWREWRSELWHVRQACTPPRGVSWPAEQEVAQFCLGAVQDALCLRGLPGQPRIPLATTMGSAAQCILWLAGLVIASYAIGQLLPGKVVVSESAHYRDARNLTLIRDARFGDISEPTISAEQYHLWKRRRQDLFDGFAFYQPMQSGLHIEGGGTFAIASSNLFDVLGLPIRFSTANGAGSARLILSDDAWKREFGGDPHVAGRTMQLGLRSVVIGGVAPPGFWRLPGKVDGWLLVPDAEVERRLGFVVGHLKSTEEHKALGASWEMAAPTPDGTMSDFACARLTERMLGTNDIFFFAVFLACLALPATTSLPLGEYRVTSQKLSWSTRLRRWGFLASKIGLLLPIVYFFSLDLSHLRATASPFTAEYVQLASSFSICLFGLRWVLRDQRQRCPVCLRRLTHPARVGQASRNFLAWSGTELICVAGHGLLHIPEIQTSWFGTQRWLYLDPSWDVLFADSGLASAGYF